MFVLTFNDPRECAVYWDRFEDRSIRPIQPYLWEWIDGDRQNDDAAIITRVNRGELDMMVLDEAEAELRVDAAVWATRNSGGILVLSHKQEEGSDHVWDTDVLLGLYNEQEVKNLIGQISGEAALAFRVVESS